MRYTLLFTVILFLQNSLVAQSGEWRVLGGVKMSSRWQKQPYSISDVDAGWHVQATQAINLGTYSLIYSRPIKTKWAWSVGLNYNAKGIKEKGLSFDLTTELIPRSFEYNKIIEYIGSLVGARYTFFDKKGWQFNAEMLLNPEIEMQGYHNMKKLAVSSMAVFNIEKALNSHFLVVLNPFFESSLMRYSKENTFGYFPYNPFGYGLMCGLKIK